MSKTKVSEAELIYKINRKDIMKEAVGSFSKNKIKLLIAVIILLTGIFNMKENSELGLILIIIGVLYISLPYIIVFANLRRIKDIEIKYSIIDDKIIFNRGTYEEEISICLVDKIEEDEEFINIIPIEGNERFSKAINLSKGFIENNEYKDFIKVLNLKIQECSNRKNKFKKRKSSELVNKNKKLLLKYEINKEDLFEFMKKDYYSVKRYKYFGIIFIILGFPLMIVNFLASIIVILFGTSYLVYPHIFYNLKVRKIEDSQMEFNLYDRQRIQVLGGGINTIIPISFLKILIDNDRFAKIIAVYKKGFVFYIPKNKIIEGDMKKLLNIVTDKRLKS